MMAVKQWWWHYINDQDCSLTMIMTFWPLLIMMTLDHNNTTFTIMISLLHLDSDDEILTFYDSLPWWWHLEHDDVTWSTIIIFCLWWWHLDYNYDTLTVMMILWLSLWHLDHDDDTSLVKITCWILWQHFDNDENTLTMMMTLTVMMTLKQWWL